jgi:hypothetical protein
MTPVEIEMLPPKTAAELIDMQKLWKERNRVSSKVPS